MDLRPTASAVTKILLNHLFTIPTGRKIMDLKGPSMFEPQATSVTTTTRTKGRHRAVRVWRSLKLRTRIALTVLVTFLLIAGGGGVAAMAASQSADGVAYSELTLSSVHHSYQVVDTKVGTKIKLYQFSATAQKVNLKKSHKVKSYDAGVKLLHHVGDSFTITVNGAQFYNSLQHANGAIEWFKDKTGSIDSKKGTISATFYLGSDGWVHKANCKNKTKSIHKSVKVKYSLSQISIAKSRSTLKVTDTMTQSGSIHAELHLSVVCTNSSANLTETGDASLSNKQTATVTASTLASAKTKIATTKVGKTNLTASQQLTSNLTASLKQSSKSKAEAKLTGHVECTDTTTTPPVQTTTPPPSTTTPPPTETTTPPPTQTTTPPPTQQPIQVCRLKDKQIVPIQPDQFDSSLYSKNVADCTVITTPPPTPKQIQVCQLFSPYQIVTISEDQFDSSKYSKNLADCAPKPQKPLVELHSKNDVDQSTVDPVTGKLDESTAQGYFTYTIWSSDSASVQVTAKYGKIRNISSANVSKTGTVTFTYVAPSDGNIPKSGLVDTITVTVNDTAAGSATQSTPITVNQVTTDSIPNS